MPLPACAACPAGLFGRLIRFPARERVCRATQLRRATPNSDRIEQKLDEV